MLPILTRFCTVLKYLMFMVTPFQFNRIDGVGFWVVVIVCELIRVLFFHIDCRITVFTFPVVFTSYFPTSYVSCIMCIAFYYPPRDVFALNTGKYRPGCIFFVYTGAPVLWILSVINFRFFNNISESM